jgi:hypothetical protein
VSVRLVSIASVALLIASCATRTGEPRVTAEGFAVHGDTIGAGATIEAPDASDIELRIRFFAGDRVVRTERDLIPSCDGACVWGTSFIIEHDTERDVDRVDVSIDGLGDEPDGAVRRLRTTTRGGRVETRLIGRPGIGTVIALRDGRPIFGVPFETQEGERQTLRIPAGDFPDNDGFMTLFYAGETRGSGAAGAD